MGMTGITLAPKHRSLPKPRVFIMLLYVLRRALILIPVYLGLTLSTFTLIRLVPGDPVEVRVGERGISPERLASICARTAGGGGEIVKLMGTSAYYAPATAAVVMAESFLSDQKRLVPAAVFCNGEYGISDLYIGLPCVIGKGGVEKVLALRADWMEEHPDTVDRLIRATDQFRPR